MLGLKCVLFYDNNKKKTIFSRRVHISEKTLSFLNGEFEVEPAYGEKREETLRVAGLKTYFITKVIKPVRAKNLPKLCLLSIYLCTFIAVT